MPYGRHIYAKASDMARPTMCTYPQYYHAIQNWKCVLWCWADFPYINIPDQETDIKHEKTTPSIRFHIYHIISHYTDHGKIPLDYKKWYMCKQESSSDESTKIYTRKELVMMDTTTSDLRTIFYILAIQMLAFHLPYLRILGTNHYG